MLFIPLSWVFCCRMSDKAVISFLPSKASKERWCGRGSVPHVVLVDDSSTLLSLNNSDDKLHPPAHLPTILVLRDQLSQVDKLQGWASLHG